MINIAPSPADESITGVRELLDQYADLHSVVLRLWTSDETGWKLHYSSDGSSPVEPSDEIGHGRSGGLKYLVEAINGDGTRATGIADFISVMVDTATRHQNEMRFLSRELAERYEEITLLYMISEILGSVISLEEAAATILEEVVETLAVKRAALWVKDRESSSLRLVAGVGVDDLVGPVPVEDPESITAAVFRNRTPMILDSDDVFPREVGNPGAERDSFLSVPVSYTPPHGEARMIGVINLVGRTIGDGFSAGDQKLVAAIASQIGAAIENSRLVADSLRQERLDRELELAHDLQLKLLPSPDQLRDYGEVAVRCVPADSVGGDFYQLFRLPNGCVGVMIADVSSHGFAAALIMALTMSAVAIHASEGDPPAEVLRRTHGTLIDELESTEMYMTLFYGVIDPTAGTLTFANAGHSHAFRIARDGEKERLNATNPPFGIVNLDNYSDQSIPWQTGEDLLFLFTDGLSEVLGPSEGEEIIVERAIELRNSDLDEAVDTLFSLQPADSSIPFDDRTAVMLRI